MTNTEGLIVKGTNGVAVAGMFMPAWLPGLSDVSTLAGLWVPILSALWLMVQIIIAIWRHVDRDEDE